MCKFGELLARGLLQTILGFSEGNKPSSPPVDATLVVATYRLLPPNHYGGQHSAHLIGGEATHDEQQWPVSNAQ
ncbi:unnamed protein product [Prunus armeniaca]